MLLTVNNEYVPLYVCITYVLNDGQQTMQQHLHVCGVRLVVYGIKQ